MTILYPNPAMTPIQPPTRSASPRLTPISRPAVRANGLPDELPPKWGWACRGLDIQTPVHLAGEEAGPPEPGDVVLVQVEKIGYHNKLTTRVQNRLRLYVGDLVMGAFGHRYATDAYEGEVRTTDDLCLLTGAGMVGTLRSKHAQKASPTRLRFRGFLADEAGRKVNLKRLLFQPTRSDGAALAGRVILMVGTGMNSGKTTSGAKLVRGLLGRGLRVAVCKLTGSVSRLDRYEMESTQAHDVRDFSDYGFPSTYLAPREELLGLFRAMLADAARAEPDVVVMEVADGVLQRETAMLLHDADVQRAVGAVVLSAACALSALGGVREVERHGLRVATVSGTITSSPLFMREFGARSEVPLGSSADDGDALAALALQGMARA